MLNNSRVSSLWHRKAKWMVKKVLIKPPSTSDEMRNLCTSIIQKRRGFECPSTAIVSTALSLWEDPNLVNALQNNQLFRNAKERIERTAYHILPSHHTASITSTDLLKEASDVFKEVFVCPVCGNNLQCAHEHAIHHHSPPRTGLQTILTDPLNSNINESDEESPSSTNPSPTESSPIGTAGKTPENYMEDAFLESDQTFSSQQSYILDLKKWFGPLVLASFAVVGLACKIYNGEISMLQFKSLSSRSFAAITILLQASNHVFEFLHLQPAT